MTRSGHRTDLVPAKLNGVAVLQILVRQSARGLRNDTLGAGQQLLQEARACDVVSVHVGVHWKRGGRRLITVEVVNKLRASVTRRRKKMTCKFLFLVFAVIG